MSTPIPERADVRQLRTQAKELLRELRATDSTAKLADAQREIARKHGFSSWPRLVAEVETPELVERMKQAVVAGDADGLERLLKGKPVLRKRLNEPMFDFDSPPILRASGHHKAERLLPVLVKYGADPNVRSSWWAGGFSALDNASPETAEILLSLGAKHDIWSAAAHGHIDLVRDFLDRGPSLVNAPGGDGERPLHFAKTLEVAELLVERGADLEIRDVDHESTPAQYQIQKPDILRLLLRHGAKPDVFMAAVLNDVALLKKVVAGDPNAPMARVGEPPFATQASEGGHIYSYKLGQGKTPQQVAAQSRSVDVLRELERVSDPVRNLVAAAWMEDADAVRRLMPSLPKLDLEASRPIAVAAMEGRVETVRLLLEAGFDPRAKGMDSGTALHVACWFGILPVVQLLVDRVPLDLRDDRHGSTPLGWACHGAHCCRNGKGDYVGVVETLIAAGADPNESANSGGTSMIDQAGDREDVKGVLRKHLSP